MLSRYTIVALTALLSIFASRPAHAGGPIASGSTVAGSVASPTFLEAWTFSGTSAQRVVISAVTTSGAMNTEIVLRAPGGATETSTTSDRLDWQLAATGTYTIEIRDSGLNDPGSYALGFVNVTVGPYTSGSDTNGGPIVSADVKTGTMSGAADIDAYTFSGTNGNRVLIDAVETAGAGYNTNILLYPPGGGALVTSSGGGNRLEFQLTATGTWTILIEDTGNDLPGSYSMSLLNVTAGPISNGSDTDGGAILSNEIKNGQFQQGVDFDAWTFSGTAGNRVVIAGIATGAGTHNTQIGLYPPGGGAAEVFTSADRVEIALALTGTYTIVIEENANDVAGTYSLSFVNVTAGPFVDGSDANGGPIVSADVKTGTMSGAADIDAYTFTGTNGNRVLIDAVETAGAGFSTNILLYPPGGGALVTSSGGGNRLEFQLTATGTWTILIEDTGNDLPGSYSMSLLNVTAGPISNGSDTDGGAILSNEIKNGQFQQGVDFDAWTFSGTAGNRVVIAGIATGAGTHNTQIGLYPPGGGAAEVFTSADRVEIALALTGTYTIVIEENANDVAGTYSLSFVNVTAGPFVDGSDANGGPIVSADVKTGTMSGAADIDAYTFSGTNGNRVLIDAVETAGAGFSTNILLYPPGGGALVTSSGGGNRLEFQLTATGTWTILIEDTGNDLPGSYSMSLLNVTAGPISNGSDTDGGAILSNEIKNGQFQQGVDFDAWTFSGTAGNRVVIAGIATGAGTHNTQIGLYPPGGGAAEVFTSADRVEIALALTGTYTIVIEENANDVAGTYSLSFVNVTAGPFVDGSDANGGPIVSADVKTGTMSGAADIDAYTFSGTNGNRVLIDAVETAGAGFSTNILLYPPGGGALVTSSGGGNRLEFQLTATGTWTILIEDTGNDLPGSYSMSLLNVTAGPISNGSDTDGGAILSNEIKNGQFQQGVDFDAWTFSGTAGNRVVIAGIATGAGTHNTQIGLYPPGGGAAEVFTSADRVEIALALTGTYTIVIEENANDVAGTYTLSFVNVTAGPFVDGSDANGGPIVSADVKTGTMSGAADIDAYTFSGTNGNRVLIDAVETAGAGYNTNILLYPPGGGALVTSSGGGNRLEFQLTATGTWTILIEDTGNDLPGSYSMSLLNVTAGPISNGSDTDGGAILSNEIKNGQFQQGVDFDAWTFSGTAGNRVVIAGIATGAGTHNTQIGLYPPGGGAAEVFTSADRVEIALALTGTYTIVIEENANDVAGTYSLSFVNVTAGPFVDGSDANGGPIVSADVKTGTMSGAADIDAYTFSGTSGNRVLIDAVETAGAGYNTNILLYPPGGGALVTSSGGGNRLEFQLTATGTWTILIEDTGNDLPGSYSMSLLNVTAGPISNGSDTDGGAILSNEIKNGQFQQGVDFDAWTFSGTAGNRVVIAGIATGAGTHNTQIGLYPPGGGAAEVFTSADRVEIALALTGTYTIVIEENANDVAGTYTLSFVNVTAGPFVDGSDANGGPIVSNDIKTGTMSGAADIDAYTFTGTSGNRILMSAVETAGAGFNTNIYLYPPGGGTAVTSSGGGNRLEFQLTATGTWTILIEDTGNDLPGSYSMSLLNVTSGPYTGGAEIDGGPIVSGVPELGTALAAADFDGYTFSATSGDTAVISAIVTSGAMNTQIALYPPAGGAALVFTSADNVTQPLALTGTYTIVIEDNAQDQTGNYTLTLNGIDGGGATGVPEEREETASSLATALMPASPSPFTNSTRLDLRLATEGAAQLRIYDVTGARVRTLVDQRLAAGIHPVLWDGNDETGGRVASGVYYAVLVTEQQVSKQKVIRIR